MNLFVFYKLAFGDHFCESFDKPNDGAICMYFLYYFLVYSSAFSFPQFLSITKLNETNYKKFVESLMMNLTVIKLNLALKVEAPPKPIVESSINEKKFYGD